MFSKKYIFTIIYIPLKLDKNLSTSAFRASPLHIYIPLKLDKNYVGEAVPAVDWEKFTFLLS